MWITDRRWMAGIVAGSAAVALSGCTGESDRAGSESPTPAGGPEATTPADDAGATDPVGDPCLVGQWESTGMDMRIDDVGMTASGGAGVAMHIDPDGQLEVSFDGMERIDYSVSGEAPSAGHFVYAGGVSGAVALPPADATSGEWEHLDEDTHTDLRAHMVVTSPFEFDLGELDLTDLADHDTGGAISSEPAVYGTWECDGDTLTSTAPAADGRTTWTFTRTGPG